MTVLESFAKYMDHHGYGTMGETLFIGRAALTRQAGDRLAWLVASGGEPPQTYLTGQRLERYAVSVNYRSVNALHVQGWLEGLADHLSSGCGAALEGYDVKAIEVEGPWTDQDIDDEERTVGMLQVTISIRKDQQ